MLTVSKALTRCQIHLGGPPGPGFLADAIVAAESSCAITILVSQEQQDKTDSTSSINIT